MKPNELVRNVLFQITQSRERWHLRVALRRPHRSRHLSAARAEKPGVCVLFVCSVAWPCCCVLVERIFSQRRLLPSWCTVFSSQRCRKTSSKRKVRGRILDTGVGFLKKQWILASERNQLSVPAAWLQNLVTSSRGQDPRQSDWQNAKRHCLWPEVPRFPGSCILWPTVAAFCRHRAETMVLKSRGAARVWGSFAVPRVTDSVSARVTSQYNSFNLSFVENGTF